MSHVHYWGGGADKGVHEHHHSHRLSQGPSQHSVHRAHFHHIQHYLELSAGKTSADIEERCALCLFADALGTTSTVEQPSAAPCQRPRVTPRWRFELSTGRRFDSNPRAPPAQS
ncbi:MAG: hypothetical protein AAF918_01420 [Pseudomonadota bacterium]